MQLVSVWLLVAAFIAPSDHAIEASHALEEARIALAGGRDMTPARVEIDAVYRYVDDEEEIKDRTVIEPNQRLYQEREIAGKVIRRSWTSKDAFIESHNGRMALDESMRADLETYFCLRQLELLILCPGAVVEGVDRADGHSKVITIQHRGQDLAEVEIAADSHRLIAIRYTETLDPDSEAERTEVRYSGYQDVAGGWTLPHRVQTLVDGQARSSYSVQSWRLEAR
ncbi:MAG: hypothetical protein AAGM22_02465 [Acidobacteriota bacterium]